MTDRAPLSIDEAISALGVSDKSVRRMLKAGLLQEQERGLKGRVLISADSIDRARASLADQRRHEPNHEVLSVQPAAEMTALERAVERLTTMLERREDLIEELHQTVRQQGDDLAQLRTERKYLPSPDRVRELEDKIAELEAKLTGPGPVTDQAGDPVRKGWIARLLGR